MFITMRLKFFLQKRKKEIDQLEGLKACQFFNSFWLYILYVNYSQLWEIANANSVKGYSEYEKKNQKCKFLKSKLDLFCFLTNF